MANRNRNSQSRQSTPKGPSQRQLRAGEVIRHALVDILRREDLREPGLAGVAVTVSEVRTTPDLKQATAFCAKLGGGLDDNAGEEEMIAALNRAAPKIRHLLGGQIQMKFTPAITFRRDETFDEAERINRLLARPEVARDLEED